MSREKYKRSSFKEELIIFVFSGFVVVSLLYRYGTGSLDSLLQLLGSKTASLVVTSLSLIVATLIMKYRMKSKDNEMKTWLLYYTDEEESRKAILLLFNFLRKKSLTIGQPIYFIYILKGGEQYLQLCVSRQAREVINEFLDTLRPEIEYKEDKMIECPRYEKVAFSNNSDSTNKVLTPIGGPTTEHEVNEKSISLGCTDTGTMFTIRTSDFFRHVGVFGATGSGKTTTCSHMAMMLAYSNLRVVIIDWHGEYSKILPSTITKVVKPVSMKFSLNPLASEEKESLIDILEDVFDLTQPQASVLSSIIRSNASILTLHEIVDTMNTNMDTGMWNREIRLAIARKLEPLKTNEGKILFSVKNDFTLPEKGCILIIDVSEINSNRLRKLFSLMYLRLLYTKALKEGPLEIVVIIDEAHNVLPKTNVNFISRMLAEIRKMKIGLVISTQSPSSINPEFLKNLNTKIIHRIVNGADKRIITDSIGSSRGLFNDLSILKTGEAIISSPDTIRPLRVRIDNTCYTGWYELSSRTQ